MRIHQVLQTTLHLYVQLANLPLVVHALPCENLRRFPFLAACMVACMFKICFTLLSAIQRPQMGHTELELRAVTAYAYAQQVDAVQIMQSHSLPGAASLWHFVLRLVCLLVGCSQPEHFSGLCEHLQCQPVWLDTRTTCG